VVADEAGIVLGRASGPPADLVGLARDSTRRADVIDGVLRDAVRMAGLEPDVRFASIVAGVSGFDDGHGEPPALATAHDRFAIVHDADIAHAGALDCGPGIVVIAGTGSVALGIGTSGVRARAGGWGYLFGDEGGALWIVREACARAMRDEDAGHPPEIATPLLEHFGLGSLRAVQHAVQHGELTRDALASAAPVVLAAAADGDRVGDEVRRLAVAALARLAHLTQRALGARNLPIAPVGGVFRNAGMLERWKWSVREYERSATLVAPRYAPVFGALLLAYKAAGVRVPVLAGALD
jgi:N-acetylglucosamine kinase-like BadF-type ATPase